MAAPNVPLCRTLKLGMRGRDVVAHKRALSRAMPNAYPWSDFSAYYGPVYAKAVGIFQRAHGLPVTSKVNPATHEQLERTRNDARTAWAFDAKAIELATAFCAEFTKTPEERVREAIVDAALFWYAHRDAIAYSQARPFMLLKPPLVPSREDCSGFATACHYAGGAPDPNGRGFDGEGYTGTLMSRGARVASVLELDLGDLIFYGYTTRGSAAFPVGSPTHVAVYVGLVQGVHSVVSNGHHPMGLYRYDYRSINHFRHYTVA